MIRFSAFSDEAGATLDEQIAALVRNNIPYTELRSVNGKNVSQLTFKEARDIRRALQDNGVRVWAVGSPLGKVSVNVDFPAYLELVKYVSELACELGTDKVRVFSFFEAYGERGRVMDQLGAMVACAAEAGVTLYHENEKDVYGDTAERVLDIRTQVKGMKFVYDPANYLQVGEDAGKTLSLLHDKTDYFHVKDVVSATGEIVPAGCGDGEIPRLVQMIRGDKVLSVEPHLKVFAGYSELDAHPMKNKFVYRSNGEAFDAAVSAIKDICAACAQEIV